MLYRVFAFGSDPWVVNVYNILTFGSRMMSFRHGAYLHSRLRIKSYLCIELSLLGGDMILKLKTSHGLVD
jgi:hypothetical protein